MNKLDKQFEQLMKGIKLDSPSKGFSLKVMERIQAEAAVQKHVIVEEYQPVISRKAWIILIAAFVSFLAYLLFFEQESSANTDSVAWSAIQDSLQKVNTKGLSNAWQSVNGLFESIPSMAYLIMLASMALWSVDLLLTRLRHSHSEIQIR
ncbi:MAG TPA: hypothetical protein DCL77_06705 [Prolixibacteraceae bacterium]|jgi:hypothetical protein|nr:hypothetical protein [Prolixibacteraceae bacterium]